MKQINFKYLIILFGLSFIMTGCNWETLPAYEEADISAVQFYYRWASDAKDPITGEPIVKENRLGTTNKIDAEAGLIEVKVDLPAASGDFTEEIRNSITLNRLWGQATISTAAIVKPIDGSPKLGTPGDWSKENKYEVMAANGTKKIWTIKVVEFKK